MIKIKLYKFYSYYELQIEHINKEKIVTDINIFAKYHKGYCWTDIFFRKFNQQELQWKNLKDYPNKKILSNDFI